MRRTYGDLDFGGNSILRVRIHPGETFYGTPEEGQAMYHLGLKGLYVWNGTEWKACSIGNITLDNLADVDVGAATTGQALVKTSTGWAAGTVTSPPELPTGGGAVLNQIAKGSIVDLLAAGTVPTGTTGTSGRVSVSIASNTIYVENRCGAARNVAWAFLA